MIIWTVRMGHYPLQSISQVDFLIIWAPSTYNSILGWPCLNAFWEVVSTYFLKIKFSTMHGVREIHGDQSLARHCYSIKLQGNKATDAYLAEGLDAYNDLAK